MEPNEGPVALKLLHAFGRFRRMHGRQGSIAGLTHSEIMVMSYVKRASTPDGAGIRVSEISTLLDVAPPTITQQINDLETRGFVEKHADPEDRRAVRIRLTPKGDRVIKAAWDAFLASFEGLVAYLGEDESNQLADLLTEAFTYFHDRREGNL